MFKSTHEILAGADAAKEGADDWNELWANALVKTQNMSRNFDAERKTEDEWAAFVKMKAATLSMRTVHVLKDICHKRGWHADASAPRETLIDKVTTNHVADAKFKEQASVKEIVLLQDNFSASLEIPWNKEVKASIAAALQSDAVNRGNTSKCGEYTSLEHTLHAWWDPQSLSCRPRACCM